MRMLGLIGLVMSLLIVGLLVKKQLGGVAVPAPAAASPQQIQQEFKQKLDAAMQQPRPMPDDAN